MKYSLQLTLYLTEREQTMKHEKLRWALIILAGLFAVVCSVFLISAPSMMDSLGELNDTISASSKMLQQMLPEFDLNEQLYREVQYEMNTAVLRGFAYQLEREEELSAEEFEAKYKDILHPDVMAYLIENKDHRAEWKGVRIKEDGKVQLRDGRTGEYREYGDCGIPGDTGRCRTCSSFA